MMERTIPIRSYDDIPSHYRGTPVERLLGWHNGFRDRNEPVSGAEMLVGMCMDYRKTLRIPEKFAYMLRSGGGNIRPSDFKVSFAVAVGGVRTLALIVHNHCGMVGVASRREPFVNGLVDVGWDREAAQQHFDSYAPLFEIGNEIDFVLSEAKRLRDRYPKVVVAPLLYNIDDNRLYCLREE